MRKACCLGLVLVLLTASTFAQMKLNYPATKKVDQVDEYFGVKVSDPYRWLEDDNSEETKAWVEAQNKVTFDYLNGIPQRESIRKRLTELWNYEKYGAPFKRGSKYFYTKNDGLQNQSVLYIADSINDPGRVFLDPNKLSADGTAALAGTSFTQDGKLMAYGVAYSGSDRSEWRVRDVATGEDLKDFLKPNRQGGISWLKDNSGFFYSRFPDAEKGKELKGQNFNQKLYFHKLGTSQDEDYVVYERPDNKEYFVGGGVTEDGNWLVLNVGKGTGPQNMVYVKNLSMEKAPIIPIVDKLENDYSYVGNDGSVFYFRTDKGAPRARLVARDVLKEAADWAEIVPQTAETLQNVDFLNNQFVLNYLKDAYTQIRIVDIKGKFVREVKLPGIGSAGGFGGDRFDTETFYTYSSYNAPPTIYRYEMKTGKSTLYRQAKVLFNPADYVVKQVKYKSKDGTIVPMFIVHKKGIKLDGNNPTLLYGYGGFNISQTPGFSVSRVVWMEMGGVYAVANIRGGAEYGEAWHEAGTKLKKQNVFDDFIAAGEWLIANKYTSKKKLAVQGGSNGGLLVGAVVNQRPDLFGAALPAVGVMDMLRFTKFTIGWAWTSDYGSPDKEDEFKALYAYSPYHNIKPGTKYPAIMVTTADHDDRVFPAHSFKYAAALQAAQAGDAPTLIRIETKAGHGAGKPTAKVIEEAADIYGFLMKNLGM
ncbi:MAG: S9 family peptidase [Acidobacteria bacterium]|nr:S9 family peptidase [Acidobacteriota bacterium]MBK8151477.1 S9 family peptidase [Acidobacteriota bacterium]MBK8812654.1 S9 family peptidase [Acidobacteriota bacterium]